MSDDLCADENNRKQSKDELKPLGATFFYANLSASPACRLTGAQSPDSNQNRNVDDGSQTAEDEHGDSNGILMEPGGGSVGTAGYGQGAEADGHPQAAKRKHRGTSALKQGKQDARKSNDAHPGRNGWFRTVFFRQLAGTGW
jgi:hypothetical protein